MLLAEGFLCRGLRDDPAALDAAIGLFEDVVRDQPSNFFARLELADALRKRFPASREAEAALRRALAELKNADLGAATTGLKQYMEENLAAIVDQRVRLLASLERLTRDFSAGRLKPPDMATFAQLLALTGPAALAQARRYLARHLARHPDATPVLRGYLESFWEHPERSDARHLNSAFLCERRAERNMD
jgi:hypothetical protein